MQAPLAQGTAVNAERIRRWLQKFGTYWSNPTRGAIEDWLDQFAEDDRDLAARLLDSVLFIDQAHVYAKYRGLLAALEGWNDDPNARVGRWAFVPFAGSTGESGDTMTHWFRTATGLNQRKFNELFCHRSELVSKKFGPDDTIVLIDDFSGSGGQATEAWKEYFSELVAGGPRVVLMLVCATSVAMTRIAESTDMNVHAGYVLQERDNFYSDSCAYFTAAERRSALTYCKRAKRSEPRGYADCGLLLVFAYKCPNNSLPVLHARSHRWAPIFPRRGDIG